MTTVSSECRFRMARWRAGSVWTQTTPGPGAGGGPSGGAADGSDRSRRDSSSSTRRDRERSFIVILLLMERVLAANASVPPGAASSVLKGVNADPAAIPVTKNATGRKNENSTTASNFLSFGVHVRVQDGLLPATVPETFFWLTAIASQEEERKKQ